MTTLEKLQIMLDAPNTTSIIAYRTFIKEIIKDLTPIKPKKIMMHYECECGEWLGCDMYEENCDHFCSRCGKQIDWSEEELT